MFDFRAHAGIQWQHKVTGTLDFHFWHMRAHTHTHTHTHAVKTIQSVILSSDLQWDLQITTEPHKVIIKLSKVAWHLSIKIASSFRIMCLAILSFYVHIGRWTDTALQTGAEQECTHT
jgi:hypothetical protein